MMTSWNTSKLDVDDSQEWEMAGRTLCVSVSNDFAQKDVQETIYTRLISNSTMPKQTIGLNDCGNLFKDEAMLALPQI